MKGYEKYKKDAILFLKVSEVARIFRVTPETVQRWIREGRIKGIRVEKWWRVPVHEVKRLMIEAGIPPEVLYHCIGSEEE